MDPKIAKKTQDTLGKIIKKPPLTDKLLAKPPFRFLHDITTSVVKQTGFMKGLHEDSELNSENVKDKDSKIAFLQKIIDFVSMVIGKPLSVRPTKIVAGHEPEKTNELLQALAQAINKQVDNEDCVKKFLNKDIVGEEKKDKEKSERKKRSEEDGENDEKRHREKSKDRDREKRDKSKHREDKDDKNKEERHRDREERHKDKEERHKDRDERHKDKEERHREREERNKEKEERNRDKEDRHKDKEDRHRDKEERHRDREERHKERKSKRRDEEGKENESPDVQGDDRIPRPTSAKGSRRRRDEVNEDEKKPTQSESKITESDLPPQVANARRQARPSSARPAPPRPKQDTVESEPTMRLGTGKPTNVITDADKQSDDEDDNFIVEDSGLPPPEPEQQPQSKPEVEDDEEHGGLVKKMLETKKELENQQSPQRKVDIERSAVSDVARRKQREQVQKEIEKLRSSIQSLTRSANPLGKIMDYVQEDLDSMQKELEKWKSENKEHALALKREKGVTDRAIEPLKAQLSDLDQAIRDQLDASAAIKSNIIKNDEKIQKMLKSIAKS